MVTVPNQILAGGIVYVSLEIFLRIIVLSHTEIINSHTDHTDLTDFYIPLNFLIICPTESWFFNGPAEMAEMAEIIPCSSLLVEFYLL